MTAKPRSKAARPAASGKNQDSGKLFHDQLLSRAPAEDLAGYTPEGLDRAVAIARETVLHHLPGTSVTDIRTDPGIASNGRPVSVITVVNDNMPFLFDSMLAETTESA